MFCQKCGQELVDDAKFCAQCGTPIDGVAPVEESELDEPIVVLKPVFIPWVTILSVLPLQIFFTIWGGGFFGGFSTVLIKGLKLPIPIWFPFVFFACLAFFGIPLLIYNMKKKTYAKTEYRFFKKRLDYYEGFFTVEEKTVDYRNITEVYLRKGIVQKKYGIGTILLTTPSVTMSQNRAMSGIQVADIKNPDEVYKQIKDLIYQARK
ncbi:MAG: PH domain-containing protein [PVC group bacterium]|nr:PH domain-containing protein [PVC group bacterium]